MNLLEILKTIWREAVSQEERKVSFFNNYAQLVHSKHYNRLYRDFRNIGELTFYDNQKDILYLKTNEGIHFATNQYYSVVLEIFVHTAYSLPPHISNKDFVVFDIGMNRAYASLFFANMEHCQHVYSFEIDKPTYQFARQNIELNPHLSDKITTYNYGLWDKNEEIEIGLDGVDGHISIKEVEQTNVKTNFTKAKVKKASEELSGIFQNIDDKQLKVLKIDVEGSEYTIFEDLHKANLLQEFDLIIGEFHNGLEGLQGYLSNFDCLYLQHENEKLGVFTYIKQNS